MAPQKLTGRVQFFVGGPFDPVHTLSVTVLDERWDEVAIIVGPYEIPRHELWGHVAAILERVEAERGIQLSLF